MSTGQILGAVVGGVVGFVGGGPGTSTELFSAALEGASIGSTIGGALDPPPGPDVRTPRLSDNAEQTSSYGAKIVTMHGKAGIFGHVVWVENGKKKIVTTKEENDGKGGGGGGSTETHAAFVTCCIVLTDHEIDGIVRMWFGSDLVANATTDDAATAVASSELFPASPLYTNRVLLDRALNSNGSAGTVRLYPGFDDQPVDPRMAADLGADACPAYRGYSYLMLYDIPLEDYNNSIAGLQVKVEAVRNGSNQGFEYLGEIKRDLPYIDGQNYGTCNYIEPEDAFSVMAVDSNISRYYNLEWSLDNVSIEGSFVTGGALNTRILTEGRTDVFGSQNRRGTWSSWLPGPNFFSASGRYREKNGIIVGSTFSGTFFGLYRWATGATSALKVSKGNRVAVDMDDSGNTYAIYQFGPVIEKYDENLVLLDSRTLVLSPSTSYSPRDSWVCWDDGMIYLISGQDARFIYAMPDDLNSDPVYIGDVGAATFTTTTASNCSVVRGIFSRFVSNFAEHAVERWKLPTIDGSGQLLSEIVRDKLESTELISPGDIDVTLLTDTVTGYATSGISSIRSKVAPLASGYSFDLIESGYQLKAVPRGLASVLTVDPNDLDARPAGSTPGTKISHTREMDSQLPKQFRLSYLDAGRNYNNNQESSVERVGSEAVGIEVFELAIVFTPDEAAQLCQQNHDRRWMEREEFTVVLPQTYRKLEAADVITVPTDYATFEWRLTGVTGLIDGRVECTAKLNAAALYTQTSAGGTRQTGNVLIPYASKSVMHLMDFPVIRDADDVAGFGAGLSGKSSGWPGGTIVKSLDSGQTWQSIQSFTGPVTAGRTLDSLSDHDCFVIDYTDTLTLNFYDSTMAISSITVEQMMLGMNYAAYGVDGRWEIVRFANVTVNADGSVTLDTWLRGLKGTEQYAGSHEDGDVFVFLADADAAFIKTNTSDIGIERLYRGVTKGKNVDTVADTTFTYTGVNKKPLNPVQASVSFTGSDAYFSFLRRSRLSSPEWTTGVELPLGETTESYEIDVMDGATVKRTLAGTSLPIEYLEADQITDWGSAQSSFEVNVYQLSALVGRGYPLNATVS